MTDIYIKDEGAFGTVSFISPEAIKVAQTSIQGRDMSDNQVDVPIGELYKILGWAISHNLSVDSEVSITIPEKTKKDESESPKTSTSS